MSSIPQPSRDAYAEARPTAVVVEPVPALARLVKAILSELGYQSVFFATPDQALATVADPAAPLDVLVSEYAVQYLPTMHLMRFIRHHRPNVPVILLNDVPLPEKAALAAGVSILNKPFTRDEFVNLLSQVQEKAA